MIQACKTAALHAGDGVY
jgi:hypothetical protein